MRLRNSPEGYGAVAQACHWATAVAVGVAWLLGDAVGDPAPGGALSLGSFAHISAGLAVLAVLTVRLVWRLVDPPPPPEPTPFGIWGDRLARLTHVLLYVLLVMTPVFGIVLQFARGEALPVFGFVEYASPVSVTRGTARAVKEVHEFLANTLLVVAAAHAGAALVHHWLLRDQTLLRMLPRRR